MIFDTETAILNRLAWPNVAANAIIVGTFSDVDLTDDGSGPVVAQLRLERIDNAGAVQGSSVLVDCVYSFSVYTDIRRATTQQKDEAAELLQDAGNAIVGWEYQPMVTPRLLQGPETHFDGRILRLAFAFSVISFFTA